jgi:hypothetical protein
MAKLSGNTILAHPETGVPTVLLAGEEVPDWASDLIGDHLIEGTAAEPSGDEAPKGNASREDWAAYAEGKGATAEELADPADGGLSRDDLRDKYGK